MWDYLLLFVFSTIILYSTYSAMSMAHAHVLRESWKGLRTSKVWNNCLACHRGCAWFKYFVWWRWSIARLCDFVGIAFFGHVILRRHDCFVSMLESIIVFMSILNFCFESYGSEYSCHNKEDHIDKYVRQHSTSKKSVFIIYLLEDEQELSLEMLDTSPMYL